MSLNNNGSDRFDDSFTGFTDFQIFRDCTEDINGTGSDEFSEYDAEDGKSKHKWKETYDPDNCYLYIDPDDYFTEEEYAEAIKDEWRTELDPDGKYPDTDAEYFDTKEEYAQALMDDMDDAEDNSCLQPENYPNKRQYEAAELLDLLRILGETDTPDIKRCRFILENADSITAAFYLTGDGKFLYSQAVLDNFTLPCTLPEEDASRQMYLEDIIRKLAGRNIPLALEIWKWCIETFLPYAEYEDDSCDTMTVDVLDSLYFCPDGYAESLVHYFSENMEFCKAVMSAGTRQSSDLPEIICTAFRENLHPLAIYLFRAEIQKAGSDWKHITSFVSCLIDECRNYNEKESMEFVRDNLMPEISKISLGMITDEIQKWETDILEYISVAEDTCKQYAFSGKNAWRIAVPDGTEYDLDVLSFDSEQKYLEALDYAKYGWRSIYDGIDSCGLNPVDFKTEEEYLQAVKSVEEYESENRENSYTAGLSELKKEVENLKRELADIKHKFSEEHQSELIKKREAAEEKRHEEEKRRREYIKGRTVYTYCSVVFGSDTRAYYYLLNDESVKPGDEVIVPAGKAERKATVVSVGRYIDSYVPYPAETAGMVIRKAAETAQNPEETDIMHKAKPE